MEKRFHKSDSVIYTYNTISYPLTENPTFLRKLVHLHARDGVTWQDIAKEIHDLRKNPSTPDGATLSTVMVDYPEFVVALTLQGCTSIIKDLVNAYLKIPAEYGWFEQVDTFAKEMIATRDYAKYCLSTPPDQQKRLSQDFWPK